MILSFDDYRNKVLGCWMGKSIGGTLGAPFEGKRGISDIAFYTQDLNGDPLPNDDLDLQLVWLHAIEKYGKFVNASILGEFWQSYVIANWGEYGAGKNNMRMGIVPPLSGYVNNIYRDSCGAFILSEIWACVAPGHPEKAVRYAFEDAIVDHSHEGVYAEIFCAAVESAAFAESDMLKLIEIGLSYIPGDCGVARGVKNVLDSYNSGLTWQEARINLLRTVPGSFGALGTLPEDMDKDVPVGSIGWDAPSNIGIIIIGWCYGEGDFGRSLCIAANCGEDADCTAGTLGSILGIITGIDGIPEKWIRPVGRNIKTMCLNLTDWEFFAPKTIDELTDRVLRVTPIFLGSGICDFMNTSNGYSINMLESNALYESPKRINAWHSSGFNDLLKLSPFCVKNDFVIFNTVFDYGEEPYIKDSIAKRFKLRIENNIKTQQWINIKWHIPEGFSVLPGINTSFSLEQYHCNKGWVDLEFIVTGTSLLQDRYDLLIEISSIGRHTIGVIPVVLINNPGGVVIEGQGLSI